jgi:hypothetical protein
MHVPIIITQWRTNVNTLNVFYLKEREIKSILLPGYLKSFKFIKMKGSRESRKCHQSTTNGQISKTVILREIRCEYYFITHKSSQQKLRGVKIKQGKR